MLPYKPQIKMLPNISREKYEAAKEVIKKTRAEKNNISTELKEVSFSFLFL